MADTFFNDDAKKQIVEAVKEIELKSSAEIVVSVRARSDEYREIDLLAGLLLATITLVVLIYHPAELDEQLMPVETLVAFAVGSIIVNKVGALKRVLMSKKRRDFRTLLAARAHFVEAGISRTRDRSGILVFVSELERVVQVVPDVGINADKLGEKWKSALAALDTAATTLDLSGFVSALKSFGPVLGETYPRREDDINELPDAPDMKTETTA
jgi:putative membrane protein